MAGLALDYSRSCGRWSESSGFFLDSPTVFELSQLGSWPTVKSIRNVFGDRVNGDRQLGCVGPVSYHLYALGKGNEGVLFKTIPDHMRIGGLSVVNAVDFRQLQSPRSSIPDPRREVQKVMPIESQAGAQVPAGSVKVGNLRAKYGTRVKPMIELKRWGPDVFSVSPGGGHRMKELPNSAWVRGFVEGIHVSEDIHREWLQVSEEVSLTPAHGASGVFPDAMAAVAQSWVRSIDRPLDNVAVYATQGTSHCEANDVKSRVAMLRPVSKSRAWDGHELWEYYFRARDSLFVSGSRAEIQVGDPGVWSGHGVTGKGTTHTAIYIRGGGMTRIVVRTPHDHGVPDIFLVDISDSEWFLRDYNGREFFTGIDQYHEWYTARHHLLYHLGPMAAASSCVWKPCDMLDEDDTGQVQLDPGIHFHVKPSWKGTISAIETKEFTRLWVGPMVIETSGSARVGIRSQVDIDGEVASATSVKLEFINYHTEVDINSSPTIYSDKYNNGKTNLNIEVEVLPIEEIE